MCNRGDRPDAPLSRGVEGIGTNSAVRVSARRPSPLDSECANCVGTGHPGFPLSRRSRTERRWTKSARKQFDKELGDGPSSPHDH